VRQVKGDGPAADRAQRDRMAAGGDTRRRRGPLAWGAAVLAAAIVALLAAAVLRPAQDNPLVQINRAAPDFTMSLYGGGTLHLSSLRGKTVVLNFWWSGCQPCVQEAPILERQWRAWKNKGVVFVGMDELDDPSTAAPRQFLQRFHVSYPNGWDPGDVDIQYGTTGQPETFFITPHGTIKSKYAMPFSDDKALAALIQEARS
jgi:cytochrome c biogenesis protein CcmG, thiol:disulfide interchange protein DsbE